MIDIDTLVGRLMDLETKYYDLQVKYHHLINEYEKLKAKHEADSAGHRDKLGSRYDTPSGDAGR